MLSLATHRTVRNFFLNVAHILAKTVAFNVNGFEVFILLTVLLVSMTCDISPEAEVDK